MSTDSWASWLAGLPEAERNRATALRQRLEDLEVPDAEDWVQAEVEGDEPVFARVVLARQLWDVPVNMWRWPGNLAKVPAAQRLVAAGADKADVLKAMRAAALMAVEAVLWYAGPVSDENAPCRLAEVDAVGALTGRVITGLDADLETFDPSGRSGADLFE